MNDFKIQILNGFKLYFDQIINIFKSRYESENKINLDELTEKTGLNTRKTRLLLNFLSDLSFNEKVSLNKTELGEIVFKNDTYFENPGTLWIMHYMAATNEYLVIWNKFFNNLKDKDTFSLSEMMQLYEELRNIVSEYTYKHHMRKEVSVLIDAYTNQKLSKLGLLEKCEDEKDKFKANRNQVISDLIFLAACIKFRDKYYKGATALEINEICHSENSPGRIFLQTEDIIRKKLENLNNRRAISLESRGDLDQIRLSNEITFENILMKYYEES